MRIHVFKTDIASQPKVDALNSFLSNIPNIDDWSVDTEDTDNVLRVVTNGILLEAKLIQLVTECGFYCESLKD